MQKKASITVNITANFELLKEVYESEIKQGAPKSDNIDSSLSDGSKTIEKFF